MKNSPNSIPSRVILASGSPRRREMLEILSIKFETCISGTSESWDPTENARVIARQLAVKKAQKCSKRDALVIGMDTLVVLGKLKLGKPENAGEARSMLSELSGRVHQVITGAALVWNGRVESGVAVTKVRFRTISSNEMDWYIDSEEPFDKAGAYAIQGLGRIFITDISGCYYNVVGFPLTLFQRLLKRFGLSILNLQRS